MIYGTECKALAATVRQDAELVADRIATALEDSIVESPTELDFLKKLISNLKEQLEEITLSHLKISCRPAMVHQKPIVTTERFRCELGDLLIVVKYRPLSGRLQANCVIYQAKMARRNTSNCDIDSNQLTLLTHWPRFSFGRKRDNEIRTLKLEPKSLGFGSYLLVPRNVAQGATLTPWEENIPLDFGTASLHWARSYGLGPTAWEVHALGGSSIDLTKRSVIRPDVHCILNQLLFESGENLRSKHVKRFVGALYRYVGLSPDPPREFHGFSERVEEDGFAALEINLEERAAPYGSSREIEKREPRCMPLKP